MDKKYTPFLIIGGAIVAYYLWNKNKKEKEASSAVAPATGGANPEGESEFGGMRRRFGRSVSASPVIAGRVRPSGKATSGMQRCCTVYNTAGECQGWESRPIGARCGGGNIG